MSDLIVKGPENAKVLVVCDAPPFRVYEQGAVMSGNAGKMFRREAEEAGLDFSEMGFIIACPPMPEDTLKSDKRATDFLASFHEDFHEIVEDEFPSIKLVMCLGKFAVQQWQGRPVKITKVRGTIQKAEQKGKPCVLPMYSPTHALSRPEVLPEFRADMRQAGDLRAAGWNPDKQQSRLELGNYEWCFDIKHLIKNPPPMIYADTETRGLRWMFKPGMLTLQMAWEEGKAIMLPMCHRYYPDMKEKDVLHLKGQVRQLFAKPKVRLMGHHFKYDLHMLANEDIHVANWHGDTIQMAFTVDENMERSNLADCCKRWVPSIAGYSDAFDAQNWHTHMWDVPHDDMLLYGCGDVDAGLRLAYVLYELAQQDKKNWNVYQRVDMPTLRMLFKMERQGIRLDKQALLNLGDTFRKEERKLYAKLIKMVPPAVRRKHLEKGLKFSRDEFVRDILFSPEGIRAKHLIGKNENISKNGRLIPRIFTEADNLPSVSTKQHMPYFKGVPFAEGFERYEQLDTMQVRYVGVPTKTDKVPVERLKSGKLPKPAVDALLRAGKSQDFIESLRLGLRMRESFTVPVKEGEVDLKVGGGGIYWLRHAPNTGFWKYLTLEDRIHSTLSKHIAVTRRTASRDPNIQNIPKHSEFADAFRRIFIATDGYVLLEADLSQIELRIAAWMANERTMLKVFRSGGDIHTATAARIMKMTVEQFNKLPEKERKHKRFLAKAVNFGFIYGQWPEGFQQYAKSQFKIDLTLEQSEQFRDDYFDLFKDMLPWHEGTEKFVRNNGFVRSLHGALRRLPSVGSDMRGIQNQAVRQGVNSPVQGFSSDLALIGMFRFGRDCNWDDMRPIGFIHDAVVLEARRSKAMEAGAAIKWYMESVPMKEWFGIEAPLPITSDVSIGPNLAEMEEHKEIKAKRPSWAQKD
jgi:uracil-DNA glycosylase family 4